MSNRSRTIRSVLVLAATNLAVGGVAAVTAPTYASIALAETAATPATTYVIHVHDGRVTSLKKPAVSAEPRLGTVLPQASCSANGCTGLDPVATGCSVGGYIADFPGTSDPLTYPTPYGTLNLMYGPNCTANWAEVDGSRAGVDFAVFNQNGQKQTWYIHSGYTYGWTNMVNGVPYAGASIGSPSDYYCESQFAASPALCTP